MNSFLPVPNIFTLYSPHDKQEAVLQTEARDFDLIPFGNNAPELYTRPMDYKPELHPDDAMFQLKVDGISAIYIDGKFWSHQGVPLHCCDHAARDMERLEKARNMKMVIACEYEAGQFRETISAMRSGKPGRGTVWVYDAVPFDQWKMNACKATLAIREEILFQAFSMVEPEMMHSGLLRSMACPKERLDEIMAEVKARKLEGIVIKDRRSNMVRSKSSSWLRLKIVNTFDGPIIEVAKGAIVVGVRGVGPVKVAAGIPPEMKAAMEANPSRLIGQIVEIEANVEPGADAPRHSRFVRSREDKVS